jgi:protein phosphatase
LKFNYRLKSFPARNKKNNEDAVAVFELNAGLLVILCDAVGGNTHSHLAGQICIDAVQEYFNDSDEPDYLNKIRNSINSANKKLIDFPRNLRLQTPLVTTLDILLLTDDFAFWGHVGDSRIYNFKNKKLHRMTKDHSVIQRLVDEGFITIREASNHLGKGIIFGAVGAGENINIDVSKLHLSSNDVNKFFICSDGVSGLLAENEIERNINIEDIDIAMDKIENLVRSKNHPDDCSFIIVESLRDGKIK